MKYPSIASIEVQDLGQLTLENDSLVIIVGPNDGGKSTFLRDVIGAIVKHQETKWISRISWDLGTRDEYQNFIDSEFSRGHDERFFLHERSGDQLGAAEVRGFYDSQKATNAAFLIRLLDASTRITLANTTKNTNVVKREIKHPYHQFFYDTALENEFSKKIHAAFGLDFRVNRTGDMVGGFLGKAPKGERLSEAYEHSIITEMQPIEALGDGLRSYAGILLNASADQRPVTLIDEPEAFLHPPQARRLGRELAEEALRTKRQTFVATHSTDIIQGALASSNRNIHLVYLNRKAATKAHFVPSGVVNEFSDSPFLSQTNALDSLFFERVILCEAPADIMFFRWILGAGELAARSTEWLWLASYGKTAIPAMVSDLNKLGVPVTSVFDIDVLLSADVMQKLCTAYAFDYSKIEPTPRELNRGLKVPPVGDTLQKIEAALTDIKEDEGDDSRNATIASIKRITNNLGKSWVLKSSGMNAVPKGQLYGRVQGVLSELRKVGIIILLEGEIENYSPQTGGHGPSWVRTVIETDAVDMGMKERIASLFLAP